MFCFYLCMNILSLYQIPQNNYSFTGKLKVPNTKKLSQLASDVVEITSKQQNMLPRKMEFTAVETTYKEIYVQLRYLNLNICTQKANLRAFYSAQDKADYQELLKQRRKLEGKLNRIAKKAGVEASDLEHNVYVKLEYNRYAPKIYNAKSKEDLEKCKELIETKELLHSRAKEMLYQLIEQKSKLL